MAVNLTIPAVAEIVAATQRVLYPPVCLLCRASCETGVDLCGACLEDLPVPGPACPCCGQPGAGAHSGLCGACIASPPPFKRTLSPLLYREPVNHFVHALKFHERLVYGRLLADLMARHIRTCDAPWPRLLVPVPLHPRRLRSRGFNQVAVIAGHLGRQLRIPVLPHAVRRVRWVPQQAGLPARKRRQNVRNSFAVTRVPEGCRVAVVDDVMTTGSTVREMARVLRAAGVEEIEVWCAARAERGAGV